MTGEGSSGGMQKRSGVAFNPPRSFKAVARVKFRETFFPDDPFRRMKDQTAARKAAIGIRYFVPILEWITKYRMSLFKYDLLAGITIASLAIPQGISYANLAKLPPVIGLYSSFVPPLVYAVFGSSNHLAVGTVAACSVLIAETIGEVAPPDADLDLYVHLVLTSALISGLFQLALGALRLGILVDFMSHSAITGFMGGTAILIILQQFKGLLGLKHFTPRTDVVSVIRAIFHNRHEWNLICLVIGVVFLIFLQATRYVRKVKPKLFWVSAIGPIIAVIVGCLLAYFFDFKKRNIPIVGHLKRGINGLSIRELNFGSEYFAAVLKAGLITGMIALAEGIAIGRSFAIQTNEQIDGNKEMVAFGLMNIIGSMTSCYLTTGPFSKTAVNFNAGCKTPMANIVQAICIMLVLLFLAPVFSYTPQVALSAIIISAMLGLIKYKKYRHLFLTDKFDFLICMCAFVGVPFISMDMGLILSVGLSLVRALLYVARPASCKLGKMPDSDHLYRDVEQYPAARGIPGFLILQMGSPVYFANGTYVKERILRLVRNEEDELENQSAGGEGVKYVVLDLGGVTAIDVTGMESLLEISRTLQNKGIKMVLVNPRVDVMDKLTISKFIDRIGKESFFLSYEDAIEACRFSLQQQHHHQQSSSSSSSSS